MTDDADLIVDEGADDDVCVYCGGDIVGDVRFRDNGAGPFCSPSCSTFYWMDNDDDPVDTTGGDDD